VRDALVRAVPLAQTRQLRRDVLRPHETLEQIAEHEPDSAFAVGAFDGEELISVGFVAPDVEAGSWRVRGMATAPRARGKGVGTLVLEALLRHATTQGARRIWCNARTPARSFYERAGLRVVSEQFEIPGIGPHFVMELTRSRHVHNTVTSQ
jgi:GNAT superfamily N-acetyltransferase